MFVKRVEMLQLLVYLVVLLALLFQKIAQVLDARERNLEKTAVAAVDSGARRVVLQQAGRLLSGSVGVARFCCS